MRQVSQTHAGRPAVCAARQRVPPSLRRYSREDEQRQPDNSSRSRDRRQPDNNSRSDGKLE